MFISQVFIVIIVIVLVRPTTEFIVVTAVTEAVTPKRSDPKVAGVGIGPTKSKPIENAAVPVLAPNHYCNASIGDFDLRTVCLYNMFTADFTRVLVKRYFPAGPKVCRFENSAPARNYVGTLF